MSHLTFPLPGVQYGKRILVSAIESRAQSSSDKPWVSVPVNEQDLSQGYKDISFRQLNNYANHAARWLSESLPETSEPFQCFAYAGPKDLRYPILAVAAAKLQKVMILPSPLITSDAQMRILDAKNCLLYLRPASMADQVGAILKDASNLHPITVPELGEFINEAEAIPFCYPRTWEEGKEDPWLVFHTSGTTGFPKPITFTQRMMAASDMGTSTPDFDLGLHRRWALQRLYTPLPSLHLIGTAMVLAFTTFLHSTVVIGPPTPPTPQIVVDILRYGQVDGSLLTPALIEELCRIPTGFDALCKLGFILYAGAPLSVTTGERLVPHVDLSPVIGSTEAGPYLTVVHDNKDAWNYVKFQKQAGAVFEHRFNDLYELVFVRQPDDRLQQIFQVYPHKDRFETNDLWVKHPVHEGFWKIIGRTDDYVALSHADGLHVSTLEPEIEAHPSVKCALIGGHGRPAPVLIVELYPEGVAEQSDEEIIASLQPYIERVNAQCHECVQITHDRVILATRDKPFIRTVKGSISRLQSLDLYKDDIAALFG